MSTDHSSYELEYMTRPEAAAAFTKYKTAILPIGATEQHGPHLPLGTDTFLAKRMAVLLAERTGAVVMPALPISYSWVWRFIPGSLVVSVDLVREFIKDIAHSISRYGCERLIVISGHGANDSAMKYAVRELKDELPLLVYYFTYPGLEQVAAKYAETPRWHGMVHACELETSWMLAVDSDLCQMDKAVAEYPPDDISLLYHHSATTMGALSQSGVFGDATRASKEKGEVMLEEIVDYMASVLETTQSVLPKVKEGGNQR